MRIIVDGDSCAREALDAVLAVGRRRSIAVTPVADRPLPGDAEPLRIPVTHGSGETDDRIVEIAVPGDLVITRDLELALRLVQQGIDVMNDRGRIWSLRDLQRRIEEAAIVEAMRRGGMAAGRFRDYDRADAAAFAAALERLIGRSRDL